MSVEKELLDVTGFKPRVTYADRQDYLAALARAVDGLGEDDFDELSTAAANWFNEACTALNNKDEIPDFDGTLSAEDDETETDDVQEVDVVEDSSSDEETETERELENIVEDPPPKKQSKTKKDPNPTKRRPGNKLDHAPIVDLKTKALDQIKLDKYGIAEGTKNSVALQMLEKGCRMADISESIGGTYYNVLGRMVKDGHKLEKAANGVLTLTHKDELGKKKGKK